MWKRLWKLPESGWSAGAGLRKADAAGSPSAAEEASQDPAALWAGLWTELWIP